jgi:hypothetical protein
MRSCDIFVVVVVVFVICWFSVEVEITSLHEHYLRHLLKRPQSNAEVPKIDKWTGGTQNDIGSFDRFLE